MVYKWQLEKIAANRLKLWKDVKAEVERLEAVNQQMLKALELASELIRVTASEDFYSQEIAQIKAAIQAAKVECAE